MVSDSDANDRLNSDLSKELDDDLGDDWESAFQAEDFMLSPEEEADQFFINEEGSDDEMDLASLLSQEETHKKKSAPSPESKDDDSTATAKEPSRSFVLPAFFLSCLTWFSSRPRSQKILFPLIALLLVIAISATLFFRSTTEQLAQIPTEESTLEKVIIQIATNESTPEEIVAPALKEEKAETHPQVINLPPPTVKPTTTLLPQAKIRKKWPLPAFFITVQAEDSDQQVIARIDLTLVLLLEPGQNVPRAKQSFIRDSIFQFYANRPAKELQHYALARGEMIHKLESWLKKDWPDNSLTSIIFNRYEIVK